jgi:hypothetical protein
MTNRALDIARKGLLAFPLLVLAVGPAAAQHTFDGNILINDANGGGNYNGSPSPCDSVIFELANSPHNDAFASTPAGFWTGSPSWPNTNWQPSAASIASGDIDDIATISYSAADTCNTCGVNHVFTQTCYRGAIDPNGADWTQGWICTGNSAQCLPGTLPPVMIHSGPQNTSQTWTSANTHLLRGKVNFTAGTKLTVQAGTIILGEFATGPSFLVIEQGALIDAQGTANAPIIMTSDQAVGTPGDWGGVVIAGNATANCADCLGGSLCQSEGDPSITFCGTNDCDSSGVLKYCRVQYSGFELSANNELNCWTFNAVGNRTVVSYLQAHRGSDDSFEWFGGAMNADHLVATGQADDGIDWQAGFRGTVQFAVVQLAPDQGDRGIEADNWEFGFDDPCRSNPLIANLTLIAPPGGGTATSGARLRRGTDAHIFNSIFYDFPAYNLRITDAESCQRGRNPYPATYACGVRVDAPVIAAGNDRITVKTYPNPVSDHADFAIRLAHDGPTRLDVFDVAGRLVANVLERTMSPGDYTISWSPGTDVAPGAYFYRLQNGGQPVVGKFVVVR